MRRGGNTSRRARLATIVWMGAALTSAVTGHETLPEGFLETDVFMGLVKPTAVRFAQNGHVFVAEKNGIIKSFRDVNDPTPTICADLRENVYSGWDRGLLGLAVDPDFPASPYIYVLYTYDGGFGEAPGEWDDGCPAPLTGCDVSARLSRLTVDDEVMVGAEMVLIHDWCQQFSSHSVGDLQFGPDGALYATAGEGASFIFVDTGQLGGNPCNDPPDEGGALRSQDVRTTGDPVGLNGSLIRIDPETGFALPGNPLFGGAVSGDDPIIAYGLRNPYRFAIHPVTGRVYIGDVGWAGEEEINCVEDPVDAVVENFGWPCYEGTGRHLGFDLANVPLCESLYASGGATAPLYAYLEDGSRSITGLAFYTGGNYPEEYHGALFFGDYSAEWIKVMFPDASGDPDPGNIVMFLDEALPVDITVGPAGDLFYVDHTAGTVRRIRYFPDNQPPVARIAADLSSDPEPLVLYGDSPLAVHFDGSGSSDGDDDPLDFAWDLDGDGDHDDSTLESPQFTYDTAGTRIVSLEVSDPGGLSSIDTVLVSVDNTPPTATILGPSEQTLWRAGDVIAFSGSAEDPETGTLPPGALSWDLVLHHCFATDPTDCHEHGIRQWSGVAGGEFIAVDHEPISFLELRLKATELRGGEIALFDTTSVLLMPETSRLTLATEPPGIELAVYGTSATTPFATDAIVNSKTTVSAPEALTLGETDYVFDSWSDGGAASHEITVSETDQTLTASYTSSCPLLSLASTSTGDGADATGGPGGSSGSRIVPLLAGFYSARDEVLSKSPTGRRWIRLYYRHAATLTRMLAERPELRRRFTALVVAIAPGLEELAASAPDGLEPPPRRRIPPQVVALLDAVLNEIEEADAEGELARDVRRERAVLGLERLAGRTYAETWARVQHDEPR